MRASPGNACRQLSAERRGAEPDPERPERPLQPVARDCPRGGARHAGGVVRVCGFGWRTSPLGGSLLLMWWSLTRTPAHGRAAPSPAPVGRAAAGARPRSRLRGEGCGLLASYALSRHTGTRHRNHYGRWCCQVVSPTRREGTALGGGVGGVQPGGHHHVGARRLGLSLLLRLRHVRLLMLTNGSAAVARLFLHGRSLRSWGATCMRL